MTYAPDAVEQGMWGLLAYETGRPPRRVEVVQTGTEEYEVNVEMERNGVEDPESVERQVRMVLPRGYELNMTWV